MRKLRKPFALTLSFLVVILVTMVSGCLNQPTRLARLTILVSGDVEGYLKNCGCSGGQTGGEVRKARLIHMERENGMKSLPTDNGLDSEVVVVDCGTFLEGKDEVYQLYSKGIVDSMKLQGYDSVGLGYGELQFSTKDNRQESQENLWNVLGDSGLPLTAANLRFIPPPQGQDFSSQLNNLIEPYRIVTKPSGFRVGIIHVVSPRMHDGEQAKIGVQITDIEVAVESLAEKHFSEADYWILTVGSPAYNSVPPVGIAQVDGLMQVFGYTLGNPLENEGSTQALFPVFVPRPYSKAKSISRTFISFGKDEKISVRSEQLSLNANINEDPASKMIADNLQPQLEDLELAMTKSRLETQGPKPWYEGQDTCRMCHSEVYDYLLESRHMEAYQSLVYEKKNRSADCLPCHVTGHGTTIGGWNIVNNNVPEFQNVTCESCHGPGEYHTMMQQQRMAGEEPVLPPDFRDNRRNEFGLLDVAPKDCRKCHDAENSIGFTFDRYWPKIDHSAEGMEADHNKEESEHPKDDGHGH